MIRLASSPLKARLGPRFHAALHGADVRQVGKLRTELLEGLGIMRGETE